MKYDATPARALEQVRRLTAPGDEHPGSGDVDAVPDPAALVRSAARRGERRGCAKRGDSCDGEPGGAHTSLLNQIPERSAPLRISAIAAPTATTVISFFFLSLTSLEPRSL